MRKTQLQCEKQRNGSVTVEPDGFLTLPNMKVPDFAERLDAKEDKFGPECLRNFSCVAYGRMLMMLVLAACIGLVNCLISRNSQVEE